MVRAASSAGQTNLARWAVRCRPSSDRCAVYALRDCEESGPHLRCDGLRNETIGICRHRVCIDEIERTPAWELHPLELVPYKNACSKKIPRPPDAGSSPARL